MIDSLAELDSYAWTERAGMLGNKLALAKAFVAVSCISGHRRIFHIMCLHNELSTTYSNSPCIPRIQQYKC